MTTKLIVCPASTTNQSVIRQSKKSWIPRFECKLSPLHVDNTSKGVSKPEETEQSLQTYPYFLSEKMKELINFIDLRARGKGLPSNNTEEAKDIVDRTKFEVPGEVPKEAGLFKKKVHEEKIIFDVPKSSLVREKKSNPSKMSRNKKLPIEVRLFYQTSTPRFRSDQRLFRTPRLFSKMYKAVVYPLKKMGMKMKHKIYKSKYKKRIKKKLKLLDILNIGTKNIPKVCRASHFPYYQWTCNPMGYLKTPKNMPNKTSLPMDKRGYETTTNPLKNLKKNSEISEDALFQIINKLLQDAKEKDTIGDLEVTIPTVGTVLNTIGAVEANHRKTKLKGTVSSYTVNPNLDIAVIIAKITHDPEHQSPTTMFLTSPQSVSTPGEYRRYDRSSSGTILPKNLEVTTKPFVKFEKKTKEKYRENSTKAVSPNDSTTDKCKIEKLHYTSSSQEQSKEGVNNLFKEIIRHISIALQAVTTSKEFLELVSCGNKNNKSITDSITQTESMSYNPMMTTNKASSFLECTADKKNWLKTKDNCRETELTSIKQKSLKSELSTPKQAVKDYIKNNFSSVSTPQRSTEIDCEDSTSTQYAVILDDEEEYFEPFNISGNSHFIVLPDTDPVVEAYQTANYKIKKSNIASSPKRKRDIKDRANIGSEDLGNPGVYEAKVLMKELERYHIMLKDPIVTKIWSFFEVPLRSTTSDLSLSSTINKIKKRKSKRNMGIHKALQKGNNFWQDDPKLRNKNFNKYKHVLRSYKQKLNSDAENTTKRLNAFSDKIKIETYSTVFDINGPESIKAPEVVKKNEKNSENVGQLNCADKMPSCLNFKFRKQFSKTSVFSSKGWHETRSIVCSEYNQVTASQVPVY